MLKKLLVLALLLGCSLLVFLQLSRDSRFERQSSQLFEQSPEQVWQLLADVDGWQKWWPGVEKVVLLGPLQVGGQIDLRLKGVPEEHPVRLISVEPGRELVWQRSGIFGSVAETSVRLHKQASGSELTIGQRVVGPQALLAEFFNAESFEQYQQVFLKSAQLYLQRRLSQPGVGEKD